jgi:hypothetical protein
VLRPPRVGSNSQRPAASKHDGVSGKICRAGEIRPGRVHTHTSTHGRCRRRRPGATTPFHQRGLWPPRPGSGAARRHVSAAAGRTRWSHRGPTQSAAARRLESVIGRPGRERAREQPTGASHGPRLHGSRSMDATRGMPDRAARLSGDRRMTGRRRRIGRESRFRSCTCLLINLIPRSITVIFISSLVSANHPHHATRTGSLRIHRVVQGWARVENDREEVVAFEKPRTRWCMHGHTISICTRRRASLARASKKVQCSTLEPQSANRYWCARESPFQALVKRPVTDAGAQPVARAIWSRAAPRDREGVPVCPSLERSITGAAKCKKITCPESCSAWPARPPFLVLVRELPPRALDSAAQRPPPPLLAYRWWRTAACVSPSYCTVRQPVTEESITWVLWMGRSDRSLYRFFCPFF